jgi:hypothetical protein
MRFDGEVGPFGIEEWPFCDEVGPFLTGLGAAQPGHFGRVFMTKS